MGGKSIFSRIKREHSNEKPNQREQELLDRINELNRAENLRLTELQEDLKEAKSQMQNHAARGCDLEAEMISLQKEILELRRLKQESDQKVDSPRQRRLDETLGVKLLKSRENLSEFSNVVFEKESTISTLQKKITALEDAVKFGQMEVEEPVYYSPKLNREKVREESIRQTLDGQYRIEKELLEKALESQRKIWEDRNAKLAKEVATLKEELKAREEQSSAPIEEKLPEVPEKLTTLEKELLEKEELIRELTNQKGNLEKKVGDLEKKTILLEKEEEEKILEKSSIEKELESRKGIIEDLKAKNSKLEEKMETIEKEVIEKFKEDIGQDEKVLSLESQSKEKDEIIEELKRSNTKLEETIEVLEKAYDDEVVGNGAKIFRLSTENEDLKMKLVEMEEKLSFHMNKVNKMMEEEEARKEEEKKRDGVVERVRSATLFEKPSSPNILRALHHSKSVDKSPSASPISSPRQRSSSATNMKKSNPFAAASTGTRAGSQKKEKESKGNNATNWVAVAPKFPTDKR